MTDDQLTRILDQQFAKFLDQVTTHVDKRIDTLRSEMTERLDRIDTTLDGIANRLDTDDQERAAMTGQIDRHDSWIGQLADQTGAKLMPKHLGSQ